MTLQLCVSSCARAITVSRPRCTTHAAQHDPRADELPPAAEPPDSPDDDDWEEFDPTPLESWILDDFDWEVEESYPERGDYWDDSLDREWDLAAEAAAMTNTPPRRASCIRMTKQARMTNDEDVRGDTHEPRLLFSHQARGRASPAVCSQAEPGNKFCPLSPASCPLSPVLSPEPRTLNPEPSHAFLMPC
jgi:hypothetical protein